MPFDICAFTRAGGQVFLAAYVRPTLLKKSLMWGKSETFSVCTTMTDVKSQTTWAPAPVLYLGLSVVISIQKVKYYDLLDILVKKNM